MLKLVNYYKDIYERFSRLGDDENAFYFFKQLETTYDRLDEIVEQIELIQN